MASWRTTRKGIGEISFKNIYISIVYNLYIYTLCTFIFRKIFMKFIFHHWQRNFLGYYKLSRHYNFALTKIFELFPESDGVIIVEGIGFYKKFCNESIVSNPTLPQLTLGKKRKPNSRRLGSFTWLLYFLQNSYPTATWPCWKSLLVSFGRRKTNLNCLVVYLHGMTMEKKVKLSPIRNCFTEQTFSAG